MLLFIIVPLLALTIISYFSINIFLIVPALSYLTCYKMNDIGEDMSCGSKFTNQIMFIIINWAEIIGLAILYWFIRNIKNELNIKREV